MLRIFDNIELKLLPDLQRGIQAAYRTDFCVGYFNLSGWKQPANYVDQWDVSAYFRSAKQFANQISIVAGVESTQGVVPVTGRSVAEVASQVRV